MLRRDNKILQKAIRESKSAAVENLKCSGWMAAIGLAAFGMCMTAPAAPFVVSLGIALTGLSGTLAAVKCAYDVGKLVSLDRIRKDIVEDAPYHPLKRADEICESISNRAGVGFMLVLGAVMTGGAGWVVPALALMIAGIGSFAGAAAASGGNAAINAAMERHDEVYAYHEAIIRNAQPAAAPAPAPAPCPLALVTTPCAAFLAVSNAKPVAARPATIDKTGDKTGWPEFAPG